jgi:hypothetical protein
LRFTISSRPSGCKEEEDLHRQAVEQLSAQKNIGQQKEQQGWQCPAAGECCNYTTYKVMDSALLQPIDVVRPGT